MEQEKTLTNLQKYKDTEETMLSNIAFSVTSCVLEMPCIQIFKEEVPDFNVVNLRDTHFSANDCADSIDRVIYELEYLKWYLKSDEFSAKQEILARQNYRNRVITGEVQFQQTEQFLKIAKQAQECMNYVINGFDVLDLEQENDFLQKVRKINTKIRSNFGSFITILNSIADIESSEVKEVIIKLENLINDCFTSIPEAPKKDVMAVAARHVGPQQLTTTNAERERLEYIQKVNNMGKAFVRLNNDLMRDLGAQYAASSKDLYLKLVKKVADFKSKLKLPISEYTSLGDAKTTYARITKFFEQVEADVETISAASYV